MLHIAVCDEDEYTRSYLSELCLQTLPDCSIHEYDDGKRLLDDELDFHIILMEITMEKMDGLQVASRLRAQAAPESFLCPVIIFITADGKRVFEALDLFAFHYLLKPLDVNKFSRVLRIAARACEKAGRETALYFRVRDSQRRLYPSEISYVESSLRKAIIHTAQETFEIYATMEDLEDKLGPAFFRCHRGFLVNMDMIGSYDKQTVRLRDGTELLMSKSRYPAFVQLYTRFLRQPQTK